MKERLTKRLENGGVKIENETQWSVVYPQNYSDYDIKAKALLRLAEYEDAEEQGLMVRLPCKIGSYIYRITGDKRKKQPDKCKVVGMWLSEDEKSSQVHLYCFKNKENWYSIALPLSEFGKTLFAEKEEAEKKLAELRGKSDEYNRR